MQKMDFFSIYSLLGQQNTVCTHRKSKTVEILIWSNKLCILALYFSLSSSLKYKFFLKPSKWKKIGYLICNDIFMNKIDEF